MPGHLFACPACHRHVRSQEPGCPFCGAALPAERPEPVGYNPAARLTRAAIFAFGAAVTLGGCTREATSAPSPPSMNPLPPTPTPPPSPTAPVAQPTPPTPPPVSTPPTDPGAMVTRYGAPPVYRPPSHGHHGAPVPRYGAPPVPDWV